VEGKEKQDEEANLKIQGLDNKRSLQFIKTRIGSAL